jgi:hypothetical protein
MLQWHEEVPFMAAARHDPYPDLRQATPRRQLLTVSELEQLFGPDATVELRSTRPEHVEADLEVVPPRRTSRWMAPVLIVVFAAASLLGYALLRNNASGETVDTAVSLGSWLGKRTLGPTEEAPIEAQYPLPPFVAKISSALPSAEAPAPASTEPPSDSAAPVEEPSVEPPSVVPEPPAAKAEPEPTRAAPAKPAARARTKPARRARAPVDVPYPAVGHEADDRATRELNEREAERLREQQAPAEDRTGEGETYPPGYIEAEIK